jgi:hypothetical protein
MSFLGRVDWFWPTQTQALFYPPTYPTQDMLHLRYSVENTTLLQLKLTNGSKTRSYGNWKLKTSVLIRVLEVMHRRSFVNSSITWPEWICFFVSRWFDHIGTRLKRTILKYSQWALMQNTIGTWFKRLDLGLRHSFGSLKYPWVSWVKNLEFRVGWVMVVTHPKAWVPSLTGGSV